MASRRLLAAVLTIMAALGGPTPVAAHDHKPPRAALKHGTLLQKGRLVAVRWVAPAGPDGCVSSLVQGAPTYPERGLPVGRDRFRFRIRFVKAERPVAVRVRARPKISAAGRASGPLEALEVSLRPRRPGGRLRAWAAILSTRIDRDLYIEVTARWPDRDGCGGRQTATWAFHLTSG